MKRLSTTCVAIALGSTALALMHFSRPQTTATAQMPGGGAGEGGLLVLPDNFLDDPKVPHDAKAGADATLTELGQFAWKEFIALNWPAKYPTQADPKRAQYDQTKKFTDTIGKFDPTKPRVVVWETYFHKAEMFPSQPKEGTGPVVPPASFDSFPPVYRYAIDPLEPIDPANQSDPKRTNWHNLDETNEITRCVLYAHSNSGENKRFQFFYEAKVNRVFHKYIVDEKLYERGTRAKVIKRTTDDGLGEYDLLRYGSRCSTTKPVDLASRTATILVQFPCGSVDSEHEGAIEVKPAWRRLTVEEANSGRYYTNRVQFYERKEGSNTLIVRNETFGLVALHIIQKTKSFPSFCYATWEHVDNPSSGLRYKNRIPGTVDGGEFPVERQHGIPSAINAVNVAVHRLIKSKNPKSIWQYYRLIGVQANATDPPGPAATQDEISTFNLANLVVETNAELQSFSGTLSRVRNQNLPAVNTFRLGRAFNAGGCLGCHGAQGQLRGYDFSVIAEKGPVKGPEPQELSDTEMRALGEALMRRKIPKRSP